MTQVEDTARQVVSDNIDDVVERIMADLVQARHNIQNTQVFRAVGEKFNSSVANKVKDSDELIDFLVETADDEENLRNQIEERLDEDLDMGDIVFDIAESVATEDEIKDIVIETISDEVSTYTGYDLSTFVAFAKDKPLDDLVTALNSNDYDELYEEYQDTLY